MQEDATPDRTRVRLQAVCRREPALDYLVLARPIKDLAAEKMWTWPASVHEIITVEGKSVPFDTNRFYLYACAGLR
jgi:hypothetical protein